MDVAFAGLVDEIMVVYQDDLTTFSKERGEHCKHLEIIFNRCLEYGISLNPKKCIFGVEEGKLLEHIVSKDGERIDLERVKAIDLIPQPKSDKGIQSFFGQINFVKRFVPNFAEKTRAISKMLKKGQSVVWSAKPSEAFKDIKEAIKEASVLISLNYSKPLQLFSFASFYTVVVVLLQKND